MPTINVTGAGGGGPTKGTPSANGAPLSAYQEASYIQGDVKGREAFQRKAQAAGARAAEAQARNERRAYDNMRKTAEFEDRNFKARSAYQARQFNNDRLNANYEDRNFKARKTFQQRAYDHSYREAQFEDRNFKARQSFASKQYTGARNLAEYENRQRDIVQRKQESEQKARDRAFERAAAVVTRKKVADAKVEATRQSRFDPNTYRSDIASKAGMAGFAGAVAGDYSAVRMQRRALDRMEKKFGGDAGVADEIRASRTRIAAGMETRGPIRNAVGGTAAFAKDIVSNPIISSALALAVTAIAAPFVATTFMRKMYSYGEEFNDYSRSSGTLGRAGNFDSGELRRRLNPGSTQRIRGIAPSWMSQYGATPQDAIDTINATGITPQSTDQAEGIARSAYRASFADGNRMSRQDLAKSGGMAANLGFVSSDEAGLDAWFKKLTIAQTTATSRGMDGTQFAHNFESLMRSGAAGGGLGLGSGQGVWNYMSTLAASGMPGGRSGDLAASGLAGMNAAIKGIGYGGDALRSTMVGTYFSKNGGPITTEGQLEALIGKDAFDKLKASEGGENTIGNIIESGKRGDILGHMTTLAPVLEGNAGAWRKIQEGSGFGMGGPRYQQQIYGGAFTGTGYPARVAEDSGRATRTKEEFIDRYGPLAQKMAERTGTAAPFWLAQWGQETGWGANAHSNNLGNIQAGRGYTGETETRWDTHRDGTRYAKQFRVYRTPEAFLDDEEKLMRQRYPGTLGAGTDYRRAGAGLVSGPYRYAEHAEYGDVIAGSANGLANNPSTRERIARLRAAGVPDNGVSPRNASEAQDYREGLNRNGSIRTDFNRDNNTPSSANAAQAGLGQLGMKGSETAAQVGNALPTGTAAEQVMKFTEKVNDMTTATIRFVESAGKFSDWVDKKIGVTGSVSGGIGALGHIAGEGPVMGTFHALRDYMRGTPTPRMPN